MEQRRTSFPHHSAAQPEWPGLVIPARERSRSPGVQRESSAFSENANPDEDWTQISNLAERRRIQNRIAQRTYRKKLKARMVAGQETGSATSSPPGSSVSLEPQRPKKDRRHTTQSPRSVRGSSLNASQEYQARLHRSHSATVSYEHGGSRSPFEGTESDTEDTWMDEYQSPATPQLSGFTFSSPPSRSTGYPSMPAASMPGFPPSQTAYGIGVGGHSNSGLGIFDGMPQYHPQQYPQADLSQYATTTATVGPSQVLYSHDVPVSSSGYSFTTAAPKRSSEPSWSPSF